MALILIIIIFKNVFAHKCYYYAYDSNATSTFSFSASMFRVYKCACVTKFHMAQLMNTYTYENGVQFKIQSL